MDLSNSGDFGQSNPGNGVRGVENCGIEVWGDLGWLKNTQTEEREKLRLAGFASPIWARLTSGGREISRLSLPPPSAPF